MKLTVDTKNLVESVNWVTKNYDIKDINAYVALVVDKKGQGNISHSNQTSFLKAPLQIVKSEIEKNEFTKDLIKIALEGRYLKQLATVLAGSGENTELEVDLDEDGAGLLVKTDNGHFTVPTFDYKIAAEPDLIQLGEVDDREIFDVLQRLSKICDSDRTSSYPVLSSVDLFFDLDNKKIVSMATDRYALGEVSIDFEPVEEAVKEYVENNPHILLPVKNANLIAQSKGLSSSITLVHETAGKEFGYLFSDGRVALFSLTNEENLEYKKFKNKASSNIKNSFTVDTAKLKKAIATVSNLSWDETKIYLEIEGEDLHIADSSGRNRVKVDISNVKLDKDSYSIKFLRVILNEAFSPISTANMNLKWADESQAFILEAVLDDGSVAENIFVFVVPSN